MQGNLPSLRDQVARATGTERDTLLIELRRLERQQNVLQAELQALGEMTRGKLAHPMFEAGDGH